MKRRIKRTAHISIFTKKKTSFNYSFCLTIYEHTTICTLTPTSGKGDVNHKIIYASKAGHAFFSKGYLRLRSAQHRVDLRKMHRTYHYDLVSLIYIQRIMIRYAKTDKRLKSPGGHA